MKKRELTYAAAIREAFDIALARDRQVFLIGEGIPDPKGAFGTTTGLQEKYGPSRVMDMPVSENGMTGVVIGAALGGLRPVLTHMRIDFSLLSMDQIVNTAAKWFFMYGGQKPVPIVIRMIIGRGWGQGPQHSQSLQALFAHIPGLKVVMPATPADAKGLLLSAIFDNNPVIFIEHRWLHSMQGVVPRGYFVTPIGKARLVQTGTDVTLITTSYMTAEGVKASSMVKEADISIEHIDLRSIKPLDRHAILASVSKTKRFIVADTGHVTMGVGSEILAMVAEAGIPLRSAPARVASPDFPAPTSWKLARDYYPTAITTAEKIVRMMGVAPTRMKKILAPHLPVKSSKLDQPDPSFIGPF